MEKKNHSFPSVAIDSQVNFTDPVYNLVDMFGYLHRLESRHLNKNIYKSDIKQK